ncbi:hypothetical protein M0804_006564 [Polistes exclamans]|nr:hypothetical protein M0804_006564 [Polistes exclamans]
MMVEGSNAVLPYRRSCRGRWCITLRGVIVASPSTLCAAPSSTRSSSSSTTTLPHPTPFYPTLPYQNPHPLYLYPTYNHTTTSTIGNAGRTGITNVVVTNTNNYYYHHKKQPPHPPSLHPLVFFILGLGRRSRRRCGARLLDSATAIFLITRHKGRKSIIQYARRNAGEEKTHRTEANRHNTGCCYYYYYYYYCYCCYTAADADAVTGVGVGVMDDERVETRRGFEIRKLSVLVTFRDTIGILKTTLPCKYIGQITTRKLYGRGNIETLRVVVAAIADVTVCSIPIPNCCCVVALGCEFYEHLTADLSFLKRAENG